MSIAMHDVLRVVSALLVRSAELTILFLFVIVVYRLTFHPLAPVPGPRLAAVSNIWHGIRVRNGRSRELGQTLHKIYGPAVRVGPNEVWFNSREAFKKIYS